METEAKPSAEAVVLQALPVGGGVLAMSRLPGSGGDYRGDLEHIASWRPALVLTVVTPGELEEAGAKDLGQDIQDKGSRWALLCVPPDHGPGDRFDAVWSQISEQARRALAGGGRVLMHSLHGGGRCGMVALRLMIETGERPEEARKRLETAFPGLLGSSAQMAWSREAARDPAEDHASAATFMRHMDR
jgi:hypothetical protein